MNRANQIEQDMMRREQQVTFCLRKCFKLNQLMGNAMNYQNNQMQKAMRIAGKM